MTSSFLKIWWALFETFAKVVTLWDRLYSGSYGFYDSKRSIGFVRFLRLKEEYWFLAVFFSVFNFFSVLLNARSVFVHASEVPAEAVCSCPSNKAEQQFKITFIDLFMYVQLLFIYNVFISLLCFEYFISSSSIPFQCWLLSISKALNCSLALLLGHDQNTSAGTSATWTKRTKF